MSEEPLKQSGEEPSKDGEDTSASERENDFEEKEDGELEPLTPERFNEVLQKVDALGLTWTADAIPRLRSKSTESKDALFSESLLELQRHYPQFPSELGAVISYVITHNKAFASVVGGDEFLEKKAVAVRELDLVSPDYTAEYFFIHSIKVPYFSNVDWEVVLKLDEKNVYNMPAVSYAILSLIFHDPSVLRDEGNRHKTVTVAANLRIIDRLISTLNDVKAALERGRDISERILVNRKKDINAPTEPQLKLGPDTAPTEPT